MKTINTVLLGLCLMAWHTIANSQTLYKQTIRGTIVDKASQIPLPGVNIIVTNTTPVLGASSDNDGNFRIEGVAVGRQTLQASFIGYQTITLSNLLITSGKELVIKVEMEEMIITTEEVVVKAYSRKDQPLNEMAMISARSFTVEETNRYAGSWFDPARMAANYAGVMAMGDQRNDIVIRGNSPLGLLWRLDGVNIPNPNHFGSMGTTGGPISILNNNLLDNSDFFTSAFPAEYGDAISGVFDLKMRCGNNEKREYTAQIGLNGFEFGAEGPFSKKSKASYLVSYRYSTLQVFNFLGISFGVSTIPQYQDLSFKLDLPNTKFGRFSLFGIGGDSYTEIYQSKKKNTDWTFGRELTDVRYGSRMGAMGFTHLIFLKNNARVKTTLALSYSGSTIKADSAFFDRPSFNYFGDDSHEIKYSFSSQYNQKLNARDNFSFGTTLDYFEVQYVDSTLRKDGVFVHINDTQGENIALWQAFAQWQHKFSNNLLLYGGIHYQQFSLNQKFSIEPRFSIKWNINTQHSLSVGSGAHSQLQPRLFYFTQTRLKDGSYNKTNENLDFTKSNQIVIGYDYLINTNLRLKLEAYYQNLHEIPVEQRKSYYSIINYGSEFYLSRVDSLVNDGKAKNYGVEFTLEKFLSNNYYFLLTASLFDSKYKGSDGIKRNTIFNSNYVANFLCGYSISIGKNNVLLVDLKTVAAGGKRFIPFDIPKSLLTHDNVYHYQKAYEDKYDDYYRLDARAGFRLNRKKFNMEFAFDVQNITKHNNVLLHYLDFKSGSIKYDYQLGLFYVFLWRVQF